MCSVVKLQLRCSQMWWMRLCWLCRDQNDLTELSISLIYISRFAVGVKDSSGHRRPRLCGGPAESGSQLTKCNILFSHISECIMDFVMKQALGGKCHVINHWKVFCITHISTKMYAIWISLNSNVSLVKTNLDYIDSVCCIYFSIIKILLWFFLKLFFLMFSIFTFS